MSAPVSLIINMAGPDRPGLVKDLSSAISASGGNWEGSRMARFEGHFAGVVHVFIDAADANVLRSSLEALAGNGMLVSVVEGSVDDEVSFSSGSTVELEVVGQDRTGIVSEISQALSALGVNVEELITGCQSAPMSGERLFKVNAVIQIPGGVNEADVQTEIESIAQDLAVTISDLED